MRAVSGLFTLQRATPSKAALLLRRNSTLSPEPVDRWTSLERHLDFLLYDVLPGEKLFAFSRYAAHDRKTCESFMKVGPSL
jgi:hypothetical protein